MPPPPALNLYRLHINPENTDSVQYTFMAQSDDNWFEREQLYFAADEGDLKKVKDLIEKG